MQMQRKFLLLCLGLLLLATSAEAANLQAGFMGIAWGSSAQKVAANESSQVGDMLLLRQFNVPFGGLKVNEVQLFFYKDAFSQAILLHEDVNALAVALSSVYGPPDVADNPQEPGMKNWRIGAGDDSENFISIGILPERNAAVVVHSAYLMAMLEGVSGK